MMATKSTMLQSQVIENLCRPYGIAVTDKDTIIVAQNGAHCVSVLSKKEHRILRTFGSGRRNEELQRTAQLFHFPRGVAVSNDGHTLITDSHQLKKVNDAGCMVKCIGERNTGNGSYMFNCPSGLSVDRHTGTIFVADCENHRVQTYSDNFDFLQTIAAPTSSDGKIVSNPVALAVDENQYIYVVEWLSKVKKISLVNGECALIIGSTQGPEKGFLSHPTGIVIDYEYNLLYVTERGNNRVSVFDTNGIFIRCIGDAGRRRYRGQLDGPYGIAIDDANMYISDYYNDRIVVYERRDIIKSTACDNN